MAGKSKTKNLIENPLEALDLDHIRSELVHAASKSAQSELKNVGNDLTEQVFGIYNEKSPTTKDTKGTASHGELQPGVEINLKAAKATPEKKKKVDVAPGMEYFNQWNRDVLQSREIGLSRDQRQLNDTVEQIKSEIVRLAKSSKILESQFKDITADQTPINIGKYHVTFFEWVLTLIKQTRTKVEDAGAWMHAIRGKKGKKGYWNQAKSMGTTFTQSNERQVATQTG